MGLFKAGFTEVVGVDIDPQPRYPFNFIQADAMTFPLEGFDFIWASPPCQNYSNLTPKHAKGNYPRLIDGIRQRLQESGTHYCIENVRGAHTELVNPMMLCGSMFDLRTQRHRYFETSFDISAPRECDHSQVPLLVTTASKASRALRAKLGIPPKSVKNAPAAYGIDWMGFAELKEAIPPAYAEYIGRHFIETVYRKPQHTEPQEAGTNP